MQAFIGTLVDTPALGQIRIRRDQLIGERNLRISHIPHPTSVL